MNILKNSVRKFTSTAPAASKVLTEEFNEVRNKLLLKYAECENQRKSHESSLKSAEKEYQVGFARQFIPIADQVFSLSQKYASSNHRELGEGIAMTASALKHTLEKHGLEMIEPVIGGKFDKISMEQVPAGKTESAEMVTKMLSHGWKLNRQVVKKAQIE
jgi:molecular chaperone GrpE